MKGGASIILVLLFILISGCKKGEKDPILSLSSRKARFSGEWKLVKGSGSMSLVNHSSKYRHIISFTISGFKALVGATNTSFTSTDSYSYHLNLKTNKDGTFTLYELFGTDSYQILGTWDFNLSSKDVKNKEAVTLNTREVSHGDSRHTHLFNFYDTKTVYRIKELRNNKLVLTVDTEVLLYDKGDNISYTAEFEFGQD